MKKTFQSEFSGVEFEEAAVELVMTFIDPILLIYYVLGIIVFLATAYKYPEFRGYIVAFFLIVFSVISMILGSTEGEALLICGSGITSVIAVLYYRSKVKVKSVGG